MEQYILELIRDNNRVIIPNFGAFIIAKEKGFTILFNNFLSFNDGLLVEHVMKKENVDKLEATDRINKFVEEINKTLDTSGSYNLKGLGTFTKDSTGILRFTQDEELNTSFFGEAETEEGGDELLDLDNSTEEKQEEEPEEKEEEPQVIAPPVENEKEEAPVAEPEEEEKEKEKEHAAFAEEQEKEKKKKQTIALFIILFIIPLIGFAVYYFGFREGDKQPNVAVKQQMYKQKEVTKKPAPKSKAVEGGIVAGPEGTVEKTKAVKEKPTTSGNEKPVVVSRKHYIITGSFKQEQNANKYMETMKSKGFASAVTIPKNGMYLVGIESFSSLTKAMARQEELLNEYKLESWILTVK